MVVSEGYLLVVFSALDSCSQVSLNDVKRPLLFQNIECLFRIQLTRQ